ncbi:MAG: hypothetical protein SFZ24_01915 [Planctomycetota bacterium]|nr:hypothetical protein [Planctomycetota bacterium]
MKRGAWPVLGVLVFASLQAGCAGDGPGGGGGAGADAPAPARTYERSRPITTSGPVFASGRAAAAQRAREKAQREAEARARAQAEAEAFERAQQEAARRGAREKDRQARGDVRGTAGPAAGARPASGETASAETARTGPASAETARTETTSTGTSGAKAPSGGAAGPTYAQVVKAWNERTGRLQKVRGSAVVSVRFTDADGDRRWEQGEGVLQVVQPGKLALSVTKVSETILWIGCDARRYWIIDATKNRRAYVGAHEAVTREKIEKLGMPAAPRDLLMLTGIAALPELAGRGVPAVRSVPGDAGTVTFDLKRDGALWRFTADAEYFEPTRIEIIDERSGEAVVAAELSEYEQVKLQGVGGFYPRMASRIRLAHAPSGSDMGLSLSELSDGGKRRLPAELFDFEGLAEKLGVKEVVDLDSQPSMRATDAEAE